MNTLKLNFALFVLLIFLIPFGCREPVGFPVYKHDGTTSDVPQSQSDSATPAGDGTTTTTDASGPVTPQDATVEEDTVDVEKPTLKAAFSAKEGEVTARFSEPLGEGAVELSNYTLKSSNNQEVPLLSAKQDAEAPQYVSLSFDKNAINSDLTYTLTVKNVEDTSGNTIKVGKNKATVHRTLYLNIVWHQHQPLYLDPVTDSLIGPWVRKHATKDYYDMTSILEGYPNVHVNVNLTSVLLRQLLEIYVARLDPFIDVMNNTMDVEGFLAAWSGKTDPFIDFLLKPTPTAANISEEDLLLVWKGPWTLLSTAAPTMKHFPEYEKLRDANRAEYDQADFLALKIFFELAWFDPDFLQGPVTLPDGSVTRVHEWLNRQGDIYTLKVPASEELARDLLIENHKIMRNVIAIHKALFYEVETGEGQVEVTTTPMYHPILPLIYDTNLMDQGQPFDPKPAPAFSFPEDARAQVFRAVRYYQDVFGTKPRGIWCGEGSVAEAIVPILVEAGFEWTATDEEVLERTLDDHHAPIWKAYRVDADKTPGGTGNDMLIVFRDTLISDRMGFEYKTWKGEDAAQHFLDEVSAMAPALGAPDRLLTVVLDGENAWEAFTQEHDAKGFHHALYSKLSSAYSRGEITTVTTSEYIHGNPSRAVPPHPIGSHTELEPLWAGSWIGATFATWIGELEENKAWEYLRKTRFDLAASGLPQPNPLAATPSDTNSYAYHVYMAYDFMYAAEGSDWFWWYGVDQTTPSNDDSPFDRSFRSQLSGVYKHMNIALELNGYAPFEVPDFPPLIQAKPTVVEAPFGEEYPAPTIDGVFAPNETEWVPPGGVFFDSDSSTAISNTDDIGAVYYGYTQDALYIGIQANETLSAKLGSNYSIAVLIDHKTIIDAELGTSSSDTANDFVPPGETESALQVARRVRLDFSTKPATLRLETANGDGTYSEVALDGVTVGGPQEGATVLEFRIPFGALNLAGPADPLNFFVVAMENGNVIDAAPSFKAKRVFDDVTNLVFVTFEVDATGAQIPLESLDINTLPAPAGNGTVYIVGKADKLADWVPNKIALSDSGKNGDAVPGDGIWTGVFGFPRGEVIQYKYTVGTGTEEGQWAGTEEFPYTNRQYVVTEDPTIKAVKLADVLGDDPPQENSLGKLTVITEESE